MSPTEKLILSRIRECYGIKLEQSKWKEILETIKTNYGEEAMPFVIKSRKSSDESVIVDGSSNNASS